MLCVNMILILLLALEGTIAAHLPNYITPCKRDDPQLNKCALAGATKAFQQYVKTGDVDFKIPILNTLMVPKYVLQVGDELTINFDNLALIGLNATKFNDVKIDLTKKQWAFTITVEQLKLEGKYEMTGNILGRPIEGQGNGLIQFDTMLIQYDLTFESETRNGEEYYKIKSSAVTHSMKQGLYEFDNLFNGDKKLGDEMNKAMNENWLEVDKKLGPSLDVLFKSLADNGFTSYFSQIPFNEILV